jgi:hypothetical protein
MADSFDLQAIAGPLIATGTSFRKKDIKKIAYLCGAPGREIFLGPAIG